MSGVMMPQGKAKGQGLGKVLQLGGAVVGGVFGGPMGAAAGASAGQAAGGMLGANKPAAEVPTTAMGRRAERMQEANANLDALRKAETAVAQLPPDQQKQYAPQILQAKKMAESEIA